MIIITILTWWTEGCTLPGSNLLTISNYMMPKFAPYFSGAWIYVSGSYIYTDTISSLISCSPLAILINLSHNLARKPDVSDTTHTVRFQASVPSLRRYFHSAKEDRDALTVIFLDLTNVKISYIRIYFPWWPLTWTLDKYLHPYIFACGHGASLIYTHINNRILCSTIISLNGNV